MTLTPAYAAALQVLADNEVGTIGSDLFGGEWGDVDAQVLCLEGVGLPSEVAELYEAPAVQVLVRGEKRGADIDAYARAKRAHDVLTAQLDNVCIDGVNYKGFEPLNGPAPLGKDKNERFVYTMNFQTFRNR